jgi:NADPH-dependent glutamate synthase beta subunit-like oxidoreductase/NAD-dependent dihydropyrimidine dehydrogenase PreA subunit
MKTPKERLHRVLVLGATPAGIAATNKLGELGIPVTLVDPEVDLHAKLGREEWRLKSGVTLNYAWRPGLLRILRNANIRTVIPGEVRSLKHSSQGFAARLKAPPCYVDADHCILCGRCQTVCPVACADGSRPIHLDGRQALPGRAVIDKRQQPLCQANCPLGVNAQGYIALSLQGKYGEALEVVRRDNVLPGICGRICTHPCETACRRGQMDEPLAIRDIKRFLADFELERAATDAGLAAVDHGGAESAAGRRSRSHAEGGAAVLIVGSGPAGLAAAADLARLGHDVTVMEKEPELGGMLRYGIGPYRLPRTILDREIDAIKAMGVRFQTSAPVDLRTGLGELRRQYTAVIVSTGTWTDRRLGVPGEDLAGVEGCLAFLTRLYRGEITELKEKVAVIGDGNAAFDLARALVRIGARVTLVSWFPADLIPADAEEIEAARAEGIDLIDRTQTIGFVGEGGHLKALRCVPTEPGAPDPQGIPWPVPVAGGEPFELAFERVFVAIGQKGNASLFADQEGLQATAHGYIAVDAEQRAALAGVYAAGDAVTGPSSVVRAMASGRQAARAVHRKLSGEDLPTASTARPLERDFCAIPDDLASLARVHMAERQAAVRRDGFAEVALGLTETQVQAEASRCLQCGVCSECLQCVDVCGSVGAIHHDDRETDLVEQAGVVIVADPTLAFGIKGDDVIRAYSTKAARDDVYAMMLRGFAAAAEAMNLLGGSTQRLRGHGLSFAPPDARLVGEMRLGVFVCRCNDSLGWASELDAYVAALPERRGVLLAETVTSACTPEGTAAMVRTIREKNLTRVVLASCVCCPLDFICTACTDQRSRLKDALFNGTGIPRAMVETCNVRGEALRWLGEDQSVAMERFTGLLDRSVHRARFLKTLPAPARPYNFTTAVIGVSEAAIKSALTLADAGMEVFLFGTSDQPLEETLVHPNIRSFDRSAVKGLRGTVGKFQVVVEIDGVQQTLQVGAVILGEQSRRRIPYMPQAGLSPHLVESSMQQQGVIGIPFFSPGATSIPGLFLANPPGIQVSQRVKGAAAALLAATVMPRRPRQNKGYTVVVKDEQCRGCGRCIQACPYQAVFFRRNEMGGVTSVVDEALCKGCGNCISVCPTNAADSPYRDRSYLEQMIEEILV